ncbi:hypothetical protein EGW08_000619 [Elysia chlorotica]|uniref:Chitin-binding type-2 domain-containing protein n=1 Tax=Elysia chlorotica TaxID=188477 RepID=A0A433UCW3_ELYCH|nr:hypothetical protein EGW08_000619 [Elysia chlorotica]
MTSSPEPTEAENSAKVHSIEETKTESHPRVLKKQEGRLSRKKAQDINLDKERHVKRKNVESKTEAPVTETTPMPSIVHQATVEMKTPLSSSRKIKWKPGIASKRHRKKVVPSSGDHNKFQEEQGQQFHSTASISRMRAHKETHNEANGAKPDEQEPTWWFRPSPRPITVGWTKLVPSRRRAWTSSRPRYRGQTPVTKAATKDVASTPPEQSSKEVHHEKEQASASASAKGSVHCPPGISGLMPHSQSCDHYVICQAGSLSEIPSYVMRCPAGTKFDSRLRICNFADKVMC